MCSEYTSPANIKKIEEVLETKVINSAKDYEWGSKVGLHRKGPVIVPREKGVEVVLKEFPSSPLPNARLSGIGNQTDGNDKESDEPIQIKRIYEVPRWKKGFEEKPILVPMENFLEFAYWGDDSGTAQAFKVPGEDVLFVAGFLFKPFMPKGDDSSAFSLVTHTATKQMLKYHFRLISIFKAKDALGYLDEMSGEERFNYVIENRYVGKLNVETSRKMAKGWEKRVEVQKHKLDKEIKYQAVLEKEGVAG